MVKDNSLSANFVLPLNDSAIVDPIKSLCCCYEENFPVALLILGSAVISNHYEALYNWFQKIPTTLAFGEVNAGRPLRLKLHSQL